MRNLSVDGLLEMLHSYYQELDEGDLLQQLANAQQGSSEDPQAFVIRVLAIKNRILTESDESRSGFNEENLKKIMCKSLESGIWSDSIRNRMRPVLTKSDVSDATILKEIGVAVQIERVRKEKFAGKKTSTFLYASRRRGSNNFRRKDKERRVNEMN